MSRRLTVPETADYLNVDVEWVRRAIRERRIAFVKVGKHVRFEESDLDAYLAANRVEAESRG